MNDECEYCRNGGAGKATLLQHCSSAMSYLLHRHKYGRRFGDTGNRMMLQDSRPQQVLQINMSRLVLLMTLLNLSCLPA